MFSFFFSFFFDNKVGEGSTLVGVFLEGAAPTYNGFKSNSTKLFLFEVVVAIIVKISFSIQLGVDFTSPKYIFL
jgi:hypothetical protein